MLSSNARREAAKIIDMARVVEPPVPIESIVKNRGIQVRYVVLHDDLSGMAFIKEGVSFIVVNSAHHPNRQRFTIAHEFAHHVLDVSQLKNSVHVDKAILRRDSVSESGTDPREIAANAFAAEMLMPEVLISSAIGDLDLNDERAVEELARSFKVSVAALNFRVIAMTASGRKKY